ncbi:MAG: hypothetical protein HY785_24425 [Oscillatoriophycideae cyanobacterium NC_groundwater_1537_Pr4_S-0.65um_50_18]|nr:hypothetical protein [Oscillatoriophycideae cyanobacterium NC_groundwater_1537_Pr4_S-0.65um_50_18]
MGAVITELVTVHQDSYVVRALVQLGGNSFASGMATETDIEKAEDRAKVRALQAFGISGSASTPALYTPHDSFVADQSYSQLMPLPPAPNNLPLEFPSQESSLTSNQEESLVEAAIAPEFERPAPPSLFSDSDLSPPLVSSAPDFNLELPSLIHSNSIENPVENSVEEVETAKFPDPALDLTPEISQSWTELPLVSPEPSLPPKPEKSSKRKAESKTSPPAAKPAAETDIGETGDRSNEIARIGVEMKRLSWTTEQGRNYLKRTYGKRSRQELDDIELLDFLRFLEAQPSPSQSLF